MNTSAIKQQINLFSNHIEALRTTPQDPIRHAEGDALTHTQMVAAALETITDNQRLVSATTRHGHPIPCYDYGFGPLWIHRDSTGITGIVRAQTWQDAYSICEDEFFPEADMTIEEIEAEHATIYMSGRELWDHENPDRPYYSLTESERTTVLQARRSKDVPFTRDFIEHPCFQEAYGFRPNGPRLGDKHNHGIYAKDLNGDSLDRLTDELIAELGVTINISNFYEIEVTTNGRNWWPFNGESEEEARAAFEEWKAKGHGVNLERNGALIAYHPEPKDE